MRYRCRTWYPALALFAAIAPSLVLADDNPDCPFGGCGKEPGARVLALPVRAMTAGLQALDGLQPGNFALRAGRVPLDICGVTHDRQPVSVGIVLDTSGSMRGSFSDLSEILQAAIGRMLDTSGPADEYFLEYVNDKATIECAFGCDVRRIRDGLQVHPQGKTALIDGLHMALHEMSKAHHSKRALLVVSDGMDNRSVHKFEELERAYADLPAPLFLLVPAARYHPGSSAAMGIRDDLVRLVRRSGGYSLAVFDGKERDRGCFMAPLSRRAAAPPLLPNRLHRLFGRDTATFYISARAN